MTPNLYAKIVGGQVRQLVMPQGGAVPPAPAGPDWYAVQWPTDPHNTGERTIRAMLQAGWPGKERIA